MGKIKKSELPPKCVYPDCFHCVFEDCILPDDIDLLGDCDVDHEIEELEEKRKLVLKELRKCGVSSRNSVEYHKISSRIHYLKNRDIKKLKNKQRYEKRKKRPHNNAEYS